MYRILHISDLHRSPDEPIDNASLVASLDQDFCNHRKEDPEIGPIDAIIVSGDIVQGVRIGETDAEKKLMQQYQSANDFLSELVDRYLGGNKKNIVIVPGNHDVDWNKAFSAMSEVSDPPPNGRTDLRQYFNNPESDYRFSFADRKLYHITDKKLYDSRFENYEKFYCDFYSGVDLAYELTKDRYWNLFELDNGNIAVAGFNSCYRNDCYRYVGSIPEGAIGQAYLGIKDSGKPYLLKIAVWHHSTSGPPEQSDYMDNNRIHEMIYRGFRLGVHGHQHRTEVSPQTISVPSEATMALVSAGSLCVGSRELPTGERRQYNIIEISDDYDFAKVHVREMMSGHVFGPRYLSEYGGKTYAEVRWSSETSPAGTPIDKKAHMVSSKIIDAERLLSEGDEGEAIKLLNTIEELPIYGRKLLLKAFENSRDWTGLNRQFVKPQSIQELVSLVSAYCELKKFTDALDAISNYGDELGIDETLKGEMLRDVQAKRDIHS
ncbi:MAG: metallophosphoesterase [Gammaproteobacteria bacterium]|nr:metallophosphoesterase [Gammaproteobacteria bacterium]